MSRPDDAAWKVVAERELLARPPYLTLSAQTVELPDGRRIDDFYQLRLPDFACIYAETRDGRVLMLRSYRHGPRRVCLNFPGGGLSAGEVPLDAARRELREETGYEAESWTPLGSFVTNVNQRCQTAHFFKATGCHAVAAPDSGDLEETSIELLSRGDLLASLDQLAGLSHVALLALATHPRLGAPPAP